MPLIFVRQTTFPFILVKTALFQTLAEIIIFLWISLALVHPELRPRSTPLTLGIVAFLAVVTLTAFLGEDLAVSLWSNPARALGVVALWHFGLLSLALSSLGIRAPYREYTFENFVSVVKQGDEQGITFPNLETLQGELARGMKEVIHAHPKNYLHYILLAEFKNQFRRFDPRYLDEAEGLIEKALALSPARQQTYYVLARNRLLRGKHEEAASLLEKAVALNPEAGDPHFYFGILAYRNGDIAKGDAEIALAQRLGRGPVTAREAMALGILVGEVKHDYQAAVRYYRRALEFPLAPEQARDVMLKIAVAYYLGGDAQNAKRTFEELVTQCGNLKQSPAFSGLKPMLDELGVRY